MTDGARQIAQRYERWFTRVHPRIYLATRGWIGHRLGWYPSLILETTGRRSGIKRSSVLPYLRGGGGYLVVASNFGGDKPPHWLFNLQADPDVTVQIRRKRFGARAEAVFPGDGDYEHLWRTVTKDGRRGPYERYSRHTARPIPVVRIVSRSGPQVE
ncbi:MAG: nitroreductase/quinone reductase family protein [Acidimicrobiales bacterium]